MYLIPPQTRFEEFWLVQQAKSPLSTKATFAPRAESAAEATDPFMPPPMIRTSKQSLLNIFILRSLRLFSKLTAKILLYSIC